MKKGQFIKVWLIIDICLVVFLACGLFLSQNKSWLIIQYDIRSANMTVVAMIVIAVILLVVVNLLFAKAYQKHHRPIRPPKPKPAPEPAPARVDVDSKGYVRGQLEYFLPIRPRLANELSTCLKQLDGIDRMQTSLGNVRARNNAPFLQVVADTLDRAEFSIKENMKAIINIAEIWNPKEAGEETWRDIYRERQQLIATIIGHNEDYLKQSAVLLTKATDLANKKAITGDGENELEATITAIDQLGAMSGLNEK